MSHWGPHPLTDRYNPTLGFGPTYRLFSFATPFCEQNLLTQDGQSRQWLSEGSWKTRGWKGWEGIQFLGTTIGGSKLVLSCPVPHITSDLLSAQVNLHSTLWIVHHFVDLRIAQKSSILTTTICISPYLHLIFFCSGPSSVFCSVKCWGFEWVDFLYFRFFIFCICT